MYSIILEDRQVKRSSYIALLAAAVACGSAITAKKAEIKTPTLQCASCEVTVTKAVEKVEGVQSVSADTDNKVVKVAYAEGVIQVGDIETAIAKSGYQANDKKADAEAYKKLPECCKVESGAH